MSGQEKKIKIEDKKKSVTIEVDENQVREFWRKFSAKVRPAIEEDDAHRALAKAREMTIVV